MEPRNFAIAKRTNLAKSGPVGLSVMPAGPDKAMVHVSVDYSKAEIPSRAYYADFSVLQKARDGYVLIFGKLVPGRPELRTMIEISFPKDMLVRQLWQSSREFHETVRKSCAPLEPLTDISLSEKTQSFRANNVFMVTLGDEALMDFYYIAPSDIHYVRERKKDAIDLNPVVRIVTGPAIVSEFLDQVAATVSGLADLEDILKVEEND